MMLPLLLASALAACGGESGPPDWGGSVDTLPGGAIHVRSPDSGVWTEATRWRLVEALRIGALESAGPDQFGSIGDVTVDGAGRIYVLEDQAQEVRVFDRDGRHVRTMGRPGGGPGELGNPLSLEWGPGGNLWVVDFGNRRYEVFDTAGVRVGSHPFPGGTFGFGNAIGPDGLLYEQITIREPETRQAIVRRRIAPEGGELQVVDTLTRPETESGETEEVNLSQGGARLRFRFPVPLTPQGRSVLVPGVGWWVTEPRPDYALALLDLHRDTVLVVERAYEPVPVTDSIRESVVEGLPGNAELDPRRIPDVHPPFTSLRRAPDGSLWVRRQTGPASDGWEVFSPEGRYLGEVASGVPVERLNIMELTEDAAYGVLEDELEVPYVVRLGIERPGGS